MSRAKKKNTGRPKPIMRPCIYCGTSTSVSPMAVNTRLRRYQHAVSIGQTYLPMCVLGSRAWAALWKG